jgi:hypothetical protein
MKVNKTFSMNFIFPALHQISKNLSLLCLRYQYTQFMTFNNVTC